MHDKGAMQLMVRCSTPSRTIEEDSDEEIEVDSAEGDRGNWHENTTPTIGKSIREILGSSVEGGAILPVRAIATTRSNAGIEENSATTKRSVEISNESRLRLVNNSQITPWIPIIMIMLECS